MQLSLTYKRCSCEKCDSLKDCLTTNAKSVDDKCNQHAGQPVRHRTFSRARQSRPRGRHSYGNQQHRLDHTYAAAEVTSAPAEPPTATMSNELLLQQQQQPTERLLKVSGHLALSATWSPKGVDPQCRQRSQGKITYVEKNKENQPPLTEYNGRLKQYQKYRTVNNKIQGISTTTIDSSKVMKLLNEERKRWIAATALLELSRVAVIFYN